MSSEGGVKLEGGAKWGVYNPKELPTIGKVGFWGGLTVGALGAFSVGAGVFLGGAMTGWHELAIGLISGGGAAALVGAGGGRALIEYGNWKERKGAALTGLLKKGSVASETVTKGLGNLGPEEVSTDEETDNGGTSIIDDDDSE